MAGVAIVITGKDADIQLFEVNSMCILEKRLIAFATRRIFGSLLILRMAIKALAHTAFLVRWLYASKIVRYPQ